MSHRLQIWEDEIFSDCLKLSNISFNFLEKIYFYLPILKIWMVIL